MAGTIASGHFSLELPEHPSYQYIEVRPKTLALGAEILGVDLSNVASNKIYAEVADALWRYHVIFFENQKLTSEAHLSLARSLGKPEVHEIFAADGEFPEISILENDETRPPEINTWHTDTTFRDKPSACSILYCQVSNDGGDTMWLNQNLAWKFETIFYKTHLAIF